MKNYDFCSKVTVKPSKSIKNGKFRLWKTAFQSFQLEGTDPSIYGMPLTTSQVAKKN